MLLDIIQRKNKFEEIFKELRKNGQIIHGLTSGAKSLMLSCLLQKTTTPIIFVAQNHHEALVYHQEIKNLCPEHHVYNFLCQEVSPYDQINSDAGVLNSQYEIFEAWQNNKISLTVTTVKALTQLYINRQTLELRKLRISRDMEIEPLELARKLTLLGYSHEGLVENRGQFSQRGDITDIYPITGDAIRIEFFGDQIESIRSFNTGTQRSIKKIDNFIIHPRFSIVRDNEDGLQDKIIAKAKEYKLDSIIQLFEPDEVNPEDETNTSLSLKDELYWEGIEYYAEFIDQAPSSIFEFIPGHTQLVFDEWQDLLLFAEDWIKKQDETFDDGILKKTLVPLQNKLHTPYERLRDNLIKFKSRLHLQTLMEAGAKQDLSYELTSYPSERFASKIEDFVSYIKDRLREKQNIIIFSEQPQRVLGILKEWDIKSLYRTNDEDDDTLGINLDDLVSNKSKKVIIQRDGLEEGCKMPDLDLVILTDRELFGKSRQAVARQKNKGKEAKQARNIYTDIAELKQGDYVVHYKHGVGIFRGTEFIELDNGRLRQEYLAIEYANEARVLIPVDQVNLLSRFNVNKEVKPKLSKLGGTEWERTKKKVKKSVQRIAQDLINLYALRQKQTGYKYPHDTPWQIEIEDSFPYQETEDQLKAIDDIKSDMESAKLVDRLVCGDAGFGKTEVVLRAVFKAIMDGKQVAILVPTTVLAQQHFDVFSDRYAPYPIRIGLLSRFRTAAQQKDVVNRLRIGECDLVIGTHRLLQKDIQFKNLSLLVIDEEQRFGVAHKEKLKQVRKDLDVISMSATPIPRTLHMSLSGIRDISLISTAPTNRKPVKTFVGEYKASLIRNAILHELERGGKIFFVHNRVEDIEAKAFEVQEIVPEASVRFAHGQMKDRELEDVMFSFVNSEFNVLVCTTIIETGIDISDANTIVINNANNFGLSQLYQLRGRVGRSDQQAYAYLLYNQAGDISDTARQRLRAIRELTNLGAGYQVAMRDMEIRGVGNVFGAEQHGQMLSVGFDLYCKILSDTIEEMKGNTEVEDLDSSCSIDIKINAYFPETWIADAKQRMNEYKRLSLTRNEGQLDNLISEWQDRFGKLPDPALNLIEIARLKSIANKSKVDSINQETDTIRIANNLRLQHWLQIQRKLPQIVQTRLNFKAGAVGARSSNSIISLKTSGLETETILNSLKDICIYIQECLAK